jgi:hypothetical protein
MDQNRFIVHFDTFHHSEKNSDMCFRFPRHRVRDLNFQDGSKENGFLVQLRLVLACLRISLQDGLQRHGKQYGFLFFSLIMQQTRDVPVYGTTSNNLLLYNMCSAKSTFSGLKRKELCTVSLELLKYIVATDPGSSW